MSSFDALPGPRVLAIASVLGVGAFVGGLALASVLVVISPDVPLVVSDAPASLNHAALVYGGLHALVGSPAAPVLLLDRGMLAFLILALPAVPLTAAGMLAAMAAGPDGRTAAIAAATGGAIAVTYVPLVVATALVAQVEVSTIPTGTLTRGPVTSPVPPGIGALVLAVGLGALGGYLVHRGPDGRVLLGLGLAVVVGFVGLVGFA